MSKKFRNSPSRLLRGLKDNLNLEMLCPGVNFNTMPQSTKGESLGLPFIEPIKRNNKINKQAGLLTSKTISSSCRPSMSETVNIEQPRILAFIDYDSGKRIRYKLDFNSPRAKKAAAQLGITYEDCITRFGFYSPLLLHRQKHSFLGPNVDERISQLRYEHHCKRVQDALKAIYEVRRDISKCLLTHFNS